ncbi:MAG TPA: SRPBCC family protein [Acidimicrobiales bacterium]|nr:SRPBCC family protein [Acidimicrobiales bacterium]
MPTTSRHIAADAAAVWALLVDTERWPVWGPTVAAATLDGGGRVIGPGSRGRVRTAVGVALPFEVTDWRDGRSWAWRVAGVPATAHAVEPLPDGGCRASIRVPWWAAAYLAVCWEGLRRIDRLACSQAVDPDR